MDQFQTPISGPELGISMPKIPNKKVPSFVIKIIVVVITVAVVTGGVFLIIRIWKPSPERVIGKMSVEMGKVKAFHSSAKVDIKSAKDWKISMFSNIDLDEADPQNPKSAGDFGIVVDVSGEQHSLKGEYKVIGELSFLKLDKIPFFYSLFGLSKIENRWIKIEETESSDDLEEEIKKQKEATKILKDRLSDKELYVIKKDLGDEKIGDINTHHYLVNLEREKIKEIIFLGSPETSETIISLIEARITYKNTVIAADLSGMRVVAELVYDDDDSYTNVNCQNQLIKDSCDNIKEISGAEPVIFASDDEYCVYASPVEGYYICIDSLGSLITTKVFPETSGYCNGRTFVCPKGIGVVFSIPEEDRKKAAEKEFSRMLEKAGEIDAEIWVGKKDNYLYKFKLGGEENIVNLKIEFSNFNKPINVKAPTHYKSLEEVLSEEETSGDNLFAEDRQKARDISIKADMSILRSEAELVYVDEADSYANLSCQHKELKDTCESIKEYAGMEPVIYSSKDEYCAWVKLLTKENGKTKYFCEDSLITAVEITVYPENKGFCNGVTFVCPL